jgi:hypothetical protein
MISNIIHAEGVQDEERLMKGLNELKETQPPHAF